MDTPVEWYDDHTESKERTIRTYNELQIPGVRMFGKFTISNAAAPLVPHYHKNAFEFHFVTNGAITFTIDDISYEVNGYDVFMTKPDVVHSTNLNPCLPERCSGFSWIPGRQLLCCFSILRQAPI